MRDGSLTVTWTYHDFPISSSIMRLIKHHLRPVHVTKTGKRLPKLGAGLPVFNNSSRDAMTWVDAALLRGYGVLHVIIIFAGLPHTKLVSMASNFNKKHMGTHKGPRDVDEGRRRRKSKRKERKAKG